jgi:hypothetical protein
MSSDVYMNEQILIITSTDLRREVSRVPITCATQYLVLLEVVLRFDVSERGLDIRWTHFQADFKEQKPSSMDIIPRLYQVRA